MADVVVRPASRQDAAAIASIYEPIVRDSAISLEERPPTSSEIVARIDHVLAGYPYFVAELSGAVIAYAYAGPYKARSAYRLSAETTLYVAEGVRGAGIGRRLYRILLQALIERGLRNALAAITLPNEASIKLHEALGFRPVGVFAHIGYKFGRWHDVGYWQCDLTEVSVSGSGRSTGG